MKWRPRFSVRTLAIFVTLFGCYFGGWEATKRFGLPKPQTWSSLEYPNVGDSAVLLADSPVPFIVRTREITTEDNGVSYWERYRFWFFGPTVILRERDLKF